MQPDMAAKWTLAFYIAIAVAAVLWQVARWPDGWNAWALAVVNRFYIRAFFHFRTNRPCPFPTDGPAIIIANHSSPMDPMFVWVGRRETIGFMMAREYYDVKFLHWIAVAMQSIPVERNGKDLAPTRAALRRLKAGKLLGVFPEGGINRESDLQAGNPGMAWLAVRSQVPVYPVYIHNSPSGESMIDPFYNFGPVTVYYGDPIDLSAYYDRKPTQDVLQEVTDIMMARIAELGDVGYTSCSSAA